MSTDCTPRVVVNARFLSQPVTGVQRFAEEISLQLRSLDPSIIFVSPHTVLREGVADKLGVMRVGKLEGHLWEQIELPRYLRSLRRPLLINLCSTGPVLYGNQVITHHDVTYVRHPESFSRSFRAAYGAVIPVLLRRCRALITVSEFSKREVGSHYGVPGERIVVVPNAVDARFVPGDVVPDERPFLLAVSSASQHKNFARLLEAYKLLSSKLAIDLKIVGGSAGNLRHEQYEEACSYGRVEFLGRCTDEELIGLYRRARLFVFPSLYEGFGIPPLEAQACGCPVAASDIEATREVLGDSAVYFDPLDPIAISTAILKAVSDPILSSRLSKAGLDNVKRYSWTSSAALIHRTIGDLQ